MFGIALVSSPTTRTQLEHAVTARRAESGRTKEKEKERTPRPSCVKDADGMRLLHSAGYRAVVD